MVTFVESPFSDGIPNMPRRMTSREKIADTIYLNLQIFSRLLFIATAIIGYYFYQLFGIILFAILGYILGILIRRSLGLRGKDPYVGFFIRMKERAEGSRRGILEWTIEIIRGNEFTQKKCLAIANVYSETKQKLIQCSSESERKKIIEELDQKVKQISYD
jgi:hypothetical protein